MSRFLLFLVVFLTALSMNLRDMSPIKGDFLSSAFADDDDDDDDDDAPRRRAPRRAAPLPAYVPNEVITHALPETDLPLVEAEGFRLLQTRVLTDGTVMRRFAKPARLSLPEARTRMRELTADSADFNHYYRPEQGADCRGADCLARDMIDWPVSTGSCGAPPLIGMIDTGLNPDHAVFSASTIELHRIDSTVPASDKTHGTAVASLLVGDPSSRSPALVPGARLIAVDAFHKVRTDERMDAFALISALDLLAQKGVRVVNLSFAGPPNDALAKQLILLDQQGIVMVAAAGNFGPTAKPAYPAAYDQVIAVTAVDRRGQIYRRANRGAHIDLAAPGVDVWTATSLSGARTQTGTSYAAPFVTAAAALLLQQAPSLSAHEVRNRLLNSARDLGEQGPDAVYGHGLLVPQDPCL